MRTQVAPGSRSCPSLGGWNKSQSDQRTLGLNARASSREGFDDKAAAFAPASRRIGAQISLLRRSSSGHALFRYHPAASVGVVRRASPPERSLPAQRQPFLSTKSRFT